MYGVSSLLSGFSATYTPGLAASSSVHTKLRGGLKDPLPPQPQSLGSIEPPRDLRSLISTHSSHRPDASKPASLVDGFGSVPRKAEPNLHRKRSSEPVRRAAIEAMKARSLQSLNETTPTPTPQPDAHTALCDRLESLRDQNCCPGDYIKICPVPEPREVTDCKASEEAAKIQFRHECSVPLSAQTKAIIGGTIGGFFGMVLIGLVLRNLRKISDYLCKKTEVAGAQPTTGGAGSGSATVSATPSLPFPATEEVSLDRVDIYSSDGHQDNPFGIQDFYSVNPS